MEPTHFLYLIHPPRPTFVMDMTAEEREVVGRHFAYLQDLANRGKLLLAGPCLDGVVPARGCLKGHGGLDGSGLWCSR